MRVVQVNLAYPRGLSGPEDLLETCPTIRDIANAVRGTGADVTVVQFFDRAADLTLDGVRYRLIRRRADGLSPWRVARTVKQSMPDVIHVNGLDFPCHTRPLCRLGVPVLVQDHASNADRGPVLRPWGLREVAGVAFTAADQAAPFLANGTLPQSVRVFPVPESSTHFTPGNRAEARRISGLAGDPAILWVGRLDANKDPLTALDAVERAAADLPGLILWCCFTGGDLLPQVETRIAASPVLRERVRLLGAVPHGEIETLCRAADLFLLASHREGSGYALIEAIACGAAPVVSDIPSFRALTGDGGLGALAPVGDSAGFTRALIQVARQPYAELRARAISHFERELSFSVVGARLGAAYAALIGSRE